MKAFLCALCLFATFAIAGCGGGVQPSHRTADQITDPWGDPPPPPPVPPMPPKPRKHDGD
jgi:hypothetical protein